MTNDLVKMARLAQRDDRMSTGALYGDLADRIEELEAKLAQQDDLVQAAVAAALREAANIARASLDGEIGYDDTLALITPDAQAALDRVVAARFGMVRAEVVRLSVEGKIDREAAERLLAAIRKGRD